MPLGIILAAAWVEVLSLVEIDHEVTRSIDFLASEQRDLPRRLRSIRAVFDYSWNMMSEGEAEVFTKLCVFRGGFTREASEAVAGANLHILIHLTNKSLIEHDMEQRRYKIHELLRQYAAQHLQASGQWDWVQHQHSEFYAQLAERAEPQLRLANQEYWFHVLETEHDNLRAAMAWSFGIGDVIVGLRIVVALRDFWFYESYHVEGQHWYELALTHIPQDQPILQGRVLLALGLLNWAQQQVEECRRNWDQALAIFREAGDRRHFAWALGLGVDSTDYPSAVERLETAISILRELDDQPGVAQMLNVLGNEHRNPPNFKQAKVAYEACLEVVRQTGEKRRECLILGNLALVAYAEHEYPQADSYSRKCAQIAHELGFQQMFFFCLDPLAGALAACGHVQEAVRLVGIVDAFLEAQGISFPPNDQQFHDRIREDLRQQLDAQTFQAFWAEGYHMPVDNAMAFALAV